MLVAADEVALTVAALAALAMFGGNPDNYPRLMPAPRGQGYFAFWFSVSISTRAVGPDEAGF